MSDEGRTERLETLKSVSERERDTAGESGYRARGVEMGLVQPLPRLVNRHRLVFLQFYG